MVGIFVLTAAVTPGDGPSQIILAVPVIILYFASVIVARFLWKAKPGPVNDAGAA
jgi:Sec-independent protein secretion pathway component TatC